MIRKVFIVIFFSFSSLHAQIVDYDLSAVLQVLQSSGEENPFWIHSNQRGRIDELTEVSSWITGAGTYYITPDSFVQLGLGGLFQSGYQDRLQFDEYYFSYENEWFLGYAGRKQRPELYRGLSATNENVVWSLNARPLPGISLQIRRPINLWEEAGIGFKATWEEFFPHEERYVEDVRVHHKSFHLIFSKLGTWRRKVALTVGFQHFVQWAGYSPDYGALPKSIADYTKIFAGQKGMDTEIGEELNALGNHLGSYEMYLDTNYKGYDIRLIYNTFFEDGSGMMLRNTPDGRYGIFIEDEEENKLVNAFIYEYYFSRHQSKNTPTTDGKDNYFNHNVYRSGWTYEQKVMGLPFILLNEDRFRIQHNNIVAHHIGLGGLAFYRHPYRFLMSYRENYGAKGGFSKPVNTVLSTFLDMRVYQDLFNMNLQMGIDFDSEEGVNVGLGLRVNKQFF